MKLATATLLFVSLAAVQAPAADAPRRPHITGVAHIALYVHDMDKARWFYRDFLGLGEPFSLNKPEGGLAMTFIKVNDRQYIELFPEVEAGTDRLNHISVETDDIEAMRVYLGSKGFKVPDKPNLARIKNLSFTIKDPDGHGVEFVQYTPDGWSMREKGKYMGDRVSSRMMHVGILVGDLERAMKFYGEVLGFQEFWRGSKDSKVLNWVNMRVPEGDSYVEFMLYDKLPEPTARGTAHHICLEVPDVAKAKAWLEARPAAKQYTRAMEIRTGTNRKRQMNLYDADGTRTEVMEPATVDGVPTPPATAPPPHSSAVMRPAVKCGEVATMSFGADVKIESAAVVAAKGPSPEHCDVRGTIFPENSFAIWLPTEWNGRFQMVGNGGTAGVISFGPMEQGLRKGYAITSTNTGHDAAKDKLATFAEHRPDNPNADRKFIDFAYQAVHETAVLGKKIVQAYYGAAPRYSYWVGCSTGGRQGLVEAQRFPEDFDGLVTGAPALDHTGNNMRVVWNGQAQLGAGEIPVAKMPALADAVYKKCDGVDGIKDGIIDDPRRCDFVSARDLPMCPGNSDNENCFTRAQADALAKIYGGVRNSDGKLLFPGMPVGAEALVKNKSGWEGNIVGKALLPLERSESYMKFMFLEPRPAPDWTWRSFNFDTDPQRMAGGAAKDNATNPDMRPLKQRGGKIIQYHGWADQQITALSSVSYYESAIEHMGKNETEDFYRLYMVPGMFHCSGGVGCGSVDWLAPLVDWVEKGVAPTVLVGAHVEDGKTTRTRPLCPYPEVAKYKGAGSIDDAANFNCARP